jgi:hypothetical protein
MLRISLEQGCTNIQIKNPSKMTMDGFFIYLKIIHGV